MAPVVGSVAGVVGEIADYVQYAALTVTGITMGATAPATMPIAGGAEVVSNVALGVQVLADGVENGNFNNTGSQAIVKAIAGTAGYKATKSIDAMKGVTDATKHATNAVATSAINITEKGVNSTISNLRSDKSSIAPGVLLKRAAVTNFPFIDKNF